ncbi:hypothetical protein DFQ30_005681 [Apophysomyces sp. BC1015]|nr:hypothetical protein DFQ30_005681 [Apophysomyces sp. BC1015]
MLLPSSNTSPRFAVYQLPSPQIPYSQPRSQQQSMNDVIVISSDEEDNAADIQPLSTRIEHKESIDTQGVNKIVIGRDYSHPIELDEADIEEDIEVDIEGIDIEEEVLLPKDSNAIEITYPHLTKEEKEGIPSLDDPSNVVDLKREFGTPSTFDSSETGEKSQIETSATIHTVEELPSPLIDVEKTSGSPMSDIFVDDDMCDTSMEFEDWFTPYSSSNDTFMSAVSKITSSKLQDDECNDDDEILVENGMHKMDFGSEPDWSYVGMLDHKEEDWSNLFEENTDTKVRTHIPPEGDLNKLLTTLEVYISSVTGPLKESEMDRNDTLSPSLNQIAMTRKAQKRLRSTLAQGKQASTVQSLSQPYRPYFPVLAWSQSTWEDWAQFEVGDLIHYPFETWEIKIMEQRIERLQTKTKRRRTESEDPLLDLANYNWEAIALDLPGRIPDDCRRFWIDREKGYNPLHQGPVMVSRQKTLWGNLSREFSFDEGSGDAIAVGIIKSKDNKVKVIAGSVCEDQVAYNRQGNLRLWECESKHLKQLRGHKTTSQLSNGAQQGDLS